MKSFETVRTSRQGLGMISEEAMGIQEPALVNSSIHARALDETWFVRFKLKVPESTENKKCPE